MEAPASSNSLRRDCHRAGDRRSSPAWCDRPPERRTPTRKTCFQIALGSSAVLQAMQHIDLLLCTQISEHFAVDQATALVDRGDSLSVGLLQILEWAAKLTVDIVHNSGPCGAWILIGRNDLVADRGESPGFIDSQKSPRSSVRAATYARSCRGSKGCLQEDTPVQFEAGFHFPFVTCRGEEVCDQHHELVWAPLSQHWPSNLRLITGV